MPPKKKRPLVWLPLVYRPLIGVRLCGRGTGSRLAGSCPPCMAPVPQADRGLQHKHRAALGSKDVQLQQQLLSHGSQACSL